MNLNRNFMELDPAQRHNVQDSGRYLRDGQYGGPEQDRQSRTEQASAGLGRVNTPY